MSKILTHSNLRTAYYSMIYSQFSICSMHKSLFLISSIWSAPELDLLAQNLLADCPIWFIAICAVETFFRLCKNFLYDLTFLTLIDRCFAVRCHYTRHLTPNQLKCRRHICTWLRFYRLNMKTVVNFPFKCPLSGQIGSALKVIVKILRLNSNKNRNFATLFQFDHMWIRIRRNYDNFATSRIR